MLPSRRWRYVVTWHSHGEHNTNVSWEVGRKSNIGFESDWWRGLLGITFDYFYEYRDRILIDAGGMSAITPAYVGASFKSANLGIVENKGFETEISHRNKIGKDFSYFIKTNISFAQNKVIRRNDPEGRLPYQRQAGYSIGVQSLYQAIGIFQTYDEIFNSPNQMGLPGNTEVKPGDLKFLDFNNDGIIDEADAFRQGYGTVPELQYGISLGANYKGLISICYSKVPDALSSVKTGKSCGIFPITTMCLKNIGIFGHLN